MRSVSQSSTENIWLKKDHRLVKNVCKEQVHVICKFFMCVVIYFHLTFVPFDFFPIWLFAFDFSNKDAMDLFRSKFIWS